MPTLHLPSAAHTLAILLLLALLAVLTPPSPAEAQQTSGRIGDSPDPTEASIAMSQAAFGDGDASHVVLGRNDVFADNLAGAGLAGGEAPLLLVDPAPAPLRASVLTEVERVLDVQGDCGEAVNGVDVLGGADAIGEEVVDDLRARGYCVERLSGATRVETSVTVAQRMLTEIFARQDDPTTGTRGPILIARDDNPADSSAAGAYAAASFAPIVVNPGDQLHPAVAGLLEPGDTAWSQVTLLGGTAALSDQVLEGARTAAGGEQAFDVPTDRIAGATRDDTSFRIASELWPRLSNTRDTALIVNGFANLDFWQYALPAGAVGGALSAPLLYVFTDSVPDPTDTYLRQQPLERLLTVGPASEVSEATRQAAEASLGSGVAPDAALPSDVPPIAYQSYEADPVAPQRPARVEAVQADGSQQRRLTDPTPPPGQLVADRAPAWSPDGRRLAFARGTGEPNSEYVDGLYVLDAAGERGLPATGDLSACSALDFDWLSDATGLLLTCSELAGASSVPFAVVDLDGTVRSSFERQSALKLGVGQLDGRDVAVLLDEAGQTLAVTELDGTLVREVALPAPAVDLDIDGDGGTAVLVTQTEVLTVDLASGAVLPTAIALGATEQLTSVLSHDGGSYVGTFNTDFEGGERRLLRLDGAGAQTVIAAEPGIGAIDVDGVSPDGQTVVVTDSYEQSYLATAPSDGGPFTLLETGDGASGASWRPPLG